MNSFEDSDMTVDTIKDAYQSGLANGLGNLVSRVLTLSEKYCEPFVAPEAKLEFPYEYAINAFDLSKAMNEIWDGIGEMDVYIANEKPFSVIKEDEMKGKEMIYKLVSDLYFIATGLAPFMPTTSAKILELIKDNKKPEFPLFARL